MTYLLDGLLDVVPLKGTALLIPAGAMLAGPGGSMGTAVFAACLPMSVPFAVPEVSAEAWTSSKRAMAFHRFTLNVTVHVYIHVYIHVLRVHIYIHACMPASMHACMHACMLACGKNNKHIIYIYTHIYMYIYIYIYYIIYIYMYIMC